MKIMVTGCAGFIGMHTSLQLLHQGHDVIGVDNINDYYDVALKEARLEQLMPKANFRFYKVDIADRQAMVDLFAKETPTRVVHLAAQAGVRYSLENPHAYIDANVQGFMNILEGCRTQSVAHLVYASSSSVYGNSTLLPSHEAHAVDQPISLYAATKKANELMAYTYSHLYQLPTTGLRFFTVYGPWGRPDMALFKFTRAMLDGEEIEIYNHGQMMRDVTYIDDVVSGILRVVDRPREKDTNGIPYHIFNIGNQSPTLLLDHVHALEEALGIEAKKKYLPIQPGDVYATHADARALQDWVGFKPNTSLSAGVACFVDWYRSYYQK